MGRRGANARAPFSGTRPAWSSRLPGLPPAPGLGAASGTRDPALPCVCMCVGQDCPWGARDPGAELVLAFGQVSRAPVAQCALARTPKRDSRTPRAWFLLLRHCLWGAGICRTTEGPSLIWNVRGNSGHLGQFAQSQSSGSAGLMGAPAFTRVLPPLAALHLALPSGDLIAWYRQHIHGDVIAPLPMNLVFLVLHGLSLFKCSQAQGLGSAFSAHLSVHPTVSAVGLSCLAP